MKKHIIFLLLAVCAAGALNAQNVLPGYNGYWDWEGRINIFDLIEFYPDRLPYLRNEIYARYGRPFVNKVYQDYFRAYRWYREKPAFTENWLTQADRENAEFIRSIEQPPLNFEATVSRVLKNIEYRSGQAVLTFTSRQELVWTDPDVDFGAYGLDGYGTRTLPWFVMGDWVLVYQYNYYYSDGKTGYGYDVAAYRLDHTGKRILNSVTSWVKEATLEKVLRSQGRLIEK